MLDVKRKLENLTSLIVPQSSPTVVQAILKRVKGTDSWERNNLRKNTQENVAMVKDPEVKFCDYVKPQRKLNTCRPSTPVEAVSSSTVASNDAQDKAVQFGKFVEEICYLSCPVDAQCAKESDDSKAKVLAILGLQRCPAQEKGDAVIQAVCNARKQCSDYPKIAMVPINDKGTQIKKQPSVDFVRHPSADTDTIMSCATTTHDGEHQVLSSSEDTDSHDEAEIVPLRAADHDEDDEDACPIRALSIS
eukprot:CAMPEP_0196731536 /NCGR_PEP_ID=MMETSP1091-20130531/11223_1 /TAXON_ID=302021 /ORGANISM="Rhodomonas sp., Strain CCMP768" /LENGTH=247 /DNA_ID=CAMNT_0042074677 /DNA_START=307 /DNA_END=1050 /DNA_ORIENTATION=-